MERSKRSASSGTTAVILVLISAVFFGLNGVASKRLYAPDAQAHFDAVSLFIARGFRSLPLTSHGSIVAGLALALALVPPTLFHRAATVK